MFGHQRQKTAYTELQKVLADLACIQDVKDLKRMSGWSRIADGLGRFLTAEINRLYQLLEKPETNREEILAANANRKALQALFDFWTEGMELAPELIERRRQLEEAIHESETALKAVS